MHALVSKNDICPSLKYFFRRAKKIFFNCLTQCIRNKSFREGGRDGSEVHVEGVHVVEKHFGYVLNERKGGGGGD